MVIVGICRTKNNQAIVEPFVRHHLKLFDWLLICDNGSVDATKQILKQLAAEDNRLVVSHDDDFGDFQTQHYDVLLHATEHYRPDYVVPLDCDEFLGVRDREVLLRILWRVPQGGNGVVCWRTFVITPDTVAACEQDPPAGFAWRRRDELPEICKVIIRTEGRSVREFSLGPGNHCTAGRSVNLRDGLPLLHFPIVSKQQMLAKTVVHWMAFLVRDAEARNSGDDAWQTVRNFDHMMAADGEITDEQLCEMSLMYAQDLYHEGKRPELVQDDHGIKYERRYSTGESMAVLPLLAKAWEQSMASWKPYKNPVALPQQLSDVWRARFHL